MNKVIMMGRLTRDPEIKYSQDNKAIARFSIAVDRRFKKDGQASADFFNCTAFGKTAEFVEKYLFRGTKVVIEGELRNNHYEKDGVTQYAEQILASSIEFAESKAATSDNQQVNTQGTMNFTDVGNDELPFA